MCKGLFPDAFIKQRKLWYKESHADLSWFMQFDSEPNNLSHKANMNCHIYFSEISLLGSVAAWQ